MELMLLAKVFGITSGCVVLLTVLVPITHYWFTRIYLPARKSKQEARKLAREILARTKETQ